MQNYKRIDGKEDSRGNTECTSELGGTSGTMDSITTFIQIGEVTEEKKLNLLIICLTHTDSIKESSIVDCIVTGSVELTGFPSGCGGRALKYFLLNGLNPTVIASI